MSALWNAWSAVTSTESVPRTALEAPAGIPARIYHQSRSDPTAGLVVDVPRFAHKERFSPISHAEEYAVPGAWLLPWDLVFNALHSLPCDAHFNRRIDQLFPCQIQNGHLEQGAL
jgi:hypothetical protein